MLFIEMQVQNPHAQVLVSHLRPTLAAVRHKLCHRDTQGLAGLATIAIRAVSEQPTSAKALRDQVGIDFVVDQMTGRGHLRARGTFRQVAAGIRSRGVKLESLQW
jgi:hypothetical protein